MKPLAVDLFCGLGGWTEGLLAEGYDVIGFDIERHQYGTHRYPGQLVVQDVRTLHGSQFKNASLIVASPPCQQYSYMAMPWSLAKAKAKAIREDTTGAKLAALNRLFNECFRIQKEASFAAGRSIPLIVENVKGAQPWIGRARWSFGSFYLWGDVPALMPIVFKASKVPGFRFDGSGKSFQSASVQEHTKNNGGSWFAIAHNKNSGKGNNPVSIPAEGIKGAGPKWDPEKGSGAYGMKRWTNPAEGSGVKCGGGWFGSYAEQKEAGTISPGRLHGKGSKKRAMASAMIAKIPLPLSRYIAATFRD